MSTRDLLRANDARFCALAGEFSDDEWSQPSLCEAWTNHDVLAHLVVGDVVVGELADRFRRGRQQLAVRLHLLNRGIHDGLEHALDQAADELGKVDGLYEVAELLNALQPDDRTIFPDQNGTVGADPTLDRQTLDHRMVVTYVTYVTRVPDVANVRANFASPHNDRVEHGRVLGIGHVAGHIREVAVGLRMRTEYFNIGESVGLEHRNHGCRADEVCLHQAGLPVPLDAKLFDAANILAIDVANLRTEQKLDVDFHASLPPGVRRRGFAR